MRSVLATHSEFTEGIEAKDLLNRPRVAQPKEMEIRYTRKEDFTNDVAEEYMDRDYVIESNNIIYPDLLNSRFF